MSPLNKILIKDFMTKNPIVLEPMSNKLTGDLRPKDDMATAYEKMMMHHIRHLPVVNEKMQLIGIFTDRDLHNAHPPRETASGWIYDKSELRQMVLTHFMTSDPTTLTPENTLKEAADIMTRNKFDCIPVVASLNSKQLVGIVTTIDVLKKISELF